MRRESVFELIGKSIDYAETKWPGWPRDPVHAAAVVVDEAGELLHAAMATTYRGGNRAEMLAEALHVAATATRFIAAHMDGHYHDRPDPLPMVMK